MAQCYHVLLIFMITLIIITIGYIRTKTKREMGKMAVTRTEKSGTLTAMIETGMAADGSATYSARSVSRINPALSDENAYNWMSAFMTLQAAPVGEIQRTNKAMLSRA